MITSFTHSLFIRTLCSIAQYTDKHIQWLQPTATSSGLQVERTPPWSLVLLQIQQKDFTADCAPASPGLFLLSGHGQWSKPATSAARLRMSGRQFPFTTTEHRRSLSFSAVDCVADLANPQPHNQVEYRAPQPDCGYSTRVGYDLAALGSEN